VFKSCRKLGRNLEIQRMTEKGKKLEEKLIFVYLIITGVGGMIASVRVVFLRNRTLRLAGWIG